MNSLLSRALLKTMRPERMRHLEELNRIQWQSPDFLIENNRTQLTTMLRHACANVPYYRDFCSQAGIDPASVGAEDLASFPLVAKQDMMANRKNFLDSQKPESGLHPNATGGSSGIWFEFYLDPGSLEMRLANDLRGRIWTGWSPGDRQAILWGHRRDNEQSNSLRGKFLADFVHRSRTLNAYDMDDKVIASYYRELRSFKPVMMLGYSSALAFLADYLKRQDLVLPSPRGIICSAETLTDSQRAGIEGYFDCPLMNRYGSREFGVVAQQCEQIDRLHIFNDRVHLEILRPDGNPCDAGERGEMVITDLDNRAMPFIRYRTGDLARFATGTCECGRGFPLLETVEGRTSELIVGKNGKYYSCQSPRLFGADIPGIGQMQLIQDTLETIEIKVVPDDKWDDTGKAQLVDRMRDLLGDIEVLVTLTDDIPPAPSGKYPFTISKISPFQ